MVVRLHQRVNVIVEVDTQKRGYDNGSCTDIGTSGIMQLLKADSASLIDPLLEGTKNGIIVKNASNAIFDVVNGNIPFQQMAADYGFKITKILDLEGNDITKAINSMHHDRMLRKQIRENKKKQ